MSDPSRPWRLGALLATAAAVLGLLAYGLRSAPAPEPEPDVPAARERPERPPVTLEPVRRGETPDGQVFWIATWNNHAATPFVLPLFSVTLHDGTGVEVQRTTGAAIHDRIDPGQSSYAFASLPTIPAYDDERLVVDGPYPADTLSPQVRLYVDDAHLDEGSSKVVARLRAPGADPVRVTRLVAVGFDEDGAASAWAEGEPPPAPVTSEPVPVALPVGPYVARPVVSWTLIAVGLPAGPG